MQTGGKRQRTQGAVRRDPDIVRFGHGGDLFGLGYTARVSNVGLDDVDAAEFKVRPDIFTGEQALAKL